PSIFPLSLHDALPISRIDIGEAAGVARQVRQLSSVLGWSGLRVVTSLDRSLERFVATQRGMTFASRLVAYAVALLGVLVTALATDRKSTRLNSSHVKI